MDLHKYGWDDFFQQESDQIKKQYKTNLIAARVAEEQREQYSVISENGKLDAEVSGKYRFNAQLKKDFPAVGDWVLVNEILSEKKAIIEHTLPRRSYISRKIAGTTAEEQIIASNIDYVFIVNGLDHDFNLRRIERYLSISVNSGATPVILLNKADLCEEPQGFISEICGIAPGVETYPLSAINGLNTSIVSSKLKGNFTGVFVGSSGAGKSTIINSLLHSTTQKTSSVRGDDSKGRHTTTARQMFVLPDGGIIIDTPGMREIQIAEGEESISASFSDIEDLAKGCKFRNCSHNSEPGCAIQEAIESGILQSKRFENYLKQKKESAYFESKGNLKGALEHKKRWKGIKKLQREFYKTDKGKWSKNT